MRSPILSVVIPCFNVAPWVAEAIDSVLRQENVELDVIAVDDGSTDGTAAVLASYGSRIRVIRQANKGLSGARNTGLAAARGEFVALLDADDVWAPNKLALQLPAFADPGVGLCSTHWVFWREAADGSFPPALSLFADARSHGSSRLQVVDYESLLCENYVMASSVVMRRSVAERTGPFDVSLRRGEDYDYWLRACRHAKLVRLDRMLTLYRMRSGSLMNTTLPMNYRAHVVDSALARWGYRNPDGSPVNRRRVDAARADAWREFSWVCRQGGRTTDARHAALQAFRLAPSAGALRGLAATLPGAEHVGAMLRKLRRAPADVPGARHEVTLPAARPAAPTSGIGELGKGAGRP